METASLLKNDRFAVYVIADVRDKRTGCFRDLVGLTRNSFAAAGLNLYNAAILLQQAGSLPVRAGRVMKGTRKLGSSHQHVLIFVKGDPKKAVQSLGEITPINLDEILRERKKAA